MSTTDDYHDLEVGVTAYRLIGIHIRPRFISMPWLMGETVAFVRRARAARYDHEDCIAQAMPAGLRRELRALVRALQSLDEAGA